MQYGGGSHRFMKLFHKIPLFFEGWLPLVVIYLRYFCSAIKKHTNNIPAFITAFV